MRGDSSGVPTLAAPGARDADPCCRLGLVTVETSLCDGCHHSAGLCLLCLYPNKTKLLYIRGLPRQRAGNAFVLVHTHTHINYCSTADMLFFFSLTLPPPPASPEWSVPLDWESSVGLRARSTSEQNRSVCCVCGSWKRLMKRFHFISIIILCQLV